MKLIRASEGFWSPASGYKKKILANEEELGAPGALVQVVVVPPQSAIRRHFHRNATEVFRIVSGKGRMNIDGQDVELLPGDTVVVEKGKIHDSRNDNDVPFEYLVFKTNWDPRDIIWLN